ncbi:protein argonaute-4-like [Penaeus monodon]|uniref:protein argonaute-4-like n=1 Tax=Penaeus monodon TaxID=6687 RepID=UPI0018A6F7CC|nr:protein argonaute-4-like [Penaeus monodon]
MVWQHMPEVPRPPLRKDLGTRGRPIKLQSNYFPVTVRKPNIKLVHYDVVIKEGDKDVHLPKKKKMLIFETMRTTYYRVFKNVGLAFDSEKNAYSINPNPQFEIDISTKFEVDISEESGKVTKYSVKMEAVQRANLQEFMQALKHKPGEKQKIIPQKINQILEVMLGHNPSLQFVKVGRNNFFPMDGEFGKPYYIGGGKEAVTGFFSSLRPAAWKDGSLLLNVDVANTSFYKEQPLLDFLMDSLRLHEKDLNQTLKPFHKKALKKELKNLKVRCSHWKILIKLSHPDSEGKGLTPHLRAVTPDPATLRAQPEAG